MTPRLSSFVSTLVFGLALLVGTSAHADGLDTIRKNGVLRVAVPQDFPPFGTVGPDLKPRGYDIDTAALLAREMGVQARAGTGHEHEPHSVPDDQQGRPGDLDAGQERRAREGDRFFGGVRPLLQRGVRPGGPQGRPAGRSRRQGDRRDARRDRGPRADQGRSVFGDDQTLRRQQLDHPGVSDRPGATGRGPATPRWRRSTNGRDCGASIRASSSRIRLATSA